MNTDISIRPAHLGGVEVQGAFADQIGFFRPPRISMVNDRFNPLDENGNPVLPASIQLQVIMLWENDSRIYYPLDESGRSTYDPDSPIPPSCYSDNKITPSDGAPQPQNDICATCPRAVKDLPSFDQKSRVAACKEKYKVACLVAGAKGKVFLLEIGPASRQPYAQYRNFLKQHHALPNQVITRLGYTNKAFEFAFEAWIDPRTAEMVKTISATDEPAMIVNAFDKPRQAALPAPQQRGGEAPAPQHKPRFDDAPGAADFASGGAGQASLSAQPTQGEQTVLEPARRRRGRPPNEAPAAPPPASFAESPTPQQSAPAPQPARTNGGGFGMETAEKPPVDIQEALNRAFGA